MKIYIPESQREPCFRHITQGCKKGCKDCYENFRTRNDRDDDWHLTWERDFFGDN